MSLQDAIDTITTTYGSLELVAQGLPVDPVEVANALNEATPDTAEYIALELLAKYNPAPAPKLKAAK